MECDNLFLHPFEGLNLLTFREPVPAERAPFYKEFRYGR